MYVKCSDFSPLCILYYSNSILINYTPILHSCYFLCSWIFVLFCAPLSFNRTVSVLLAGEVISGYKTEGSNFLVFETMNNKQFRNKDLLKSFSIHVWLVTDSILCRSNAGVPIFDVCIFHVDDIWSHFFCLLHSFSYIPSLTFFSSSSSEFTKSLRRQYNFII